MEITLVFAGVAVSVYESARGWYERLLGRPPDMLPTNDEAVWQLASTGSIYVVADRERAGMGLITIAVNDLEEHLAAPGEHGIPSARTDAREAGPRKVVVNDPDGNTISFFEDPRGGN
jgi:catechol 2,3-dioxygenase-like lactoylglutathione lyase family enzyme